MPTEAARRGQKGREGDGAEPRPPWSSPVTESIWTMEEVPGRRRSYSEMSAPTATRARTRRRRGKETLAAPENAFEEELAVPGRASTTPQLCTWPMHTCGLTRDSGRFVQAQLSSI